MPQPAIPRWILVGFAVAIGLVVVGGIWMYRSQEQRHLQEAEETLLAVGLLKSDAIHEWRTERLADAASFSESPFLVEAIVAFLADGANEAALVARFRSMCRNFGYSNVELVDATGRVRAATADGDVSLHDQESRAVALAWATRAPQATDLHRTADEGIHLEVVAPIFDPATEASPPLGALVLDLDAARFLFPLVQAWPTPSASAETLLVERDGDDVVFLNDLRHIQDTALRLRFPLTRTDVPAVLAVLGQTGVVRGTDYRGVDVLAALLPIEGSPWFMIAKVDMAEVLAPWHEQSILILSLVASLLALLASLGGAVWWRTRKEQYRTLAAAQQGLRAASEREAALLAAVPDIIMEVDQNKVYTWANQAGLDFFGDDVVGKQASSFFVGDQETYQAVEPLFRGAEDVIYVESWQRRKDGEARLLGWSCKVLRGADGSAIGGLSSARDLTERKATEDALRDSEAQLRATFDEAPVGVALVGLDGRFQKCNKALCGFLGFSEEQLRERTVAEVTFPDDVSVSMQAVRQVGTGSQRTSVVEKRYVRSDGVVVWGEVTVNLVRDDKGQPMALLPVIQDITERKAGEAQREKLEAQLRHAQKMEAVGRLAGGVAHDFNNLLTAIRGNAALALDLAPEGELKQHLHDIEEAGRRATEVTAQLLAYSRRQVIEPRLLDLNATVGNLGRMLARLLGEDVRLETFLGADLWAVKVDPTQMEQVIMNLAVNARDAMPEGGRLTLETQNVVLDEAYADGHAHTPPGEYVALVLTDTGCGMDAATKEHLFEPFFTTKEQGRGTGLGLATVYGIVKQNGGSIEVYSEPGQGSTVRVYLPRAEGTPDEVAPVRVHADLPRGDETLLLVEDDPAVARIVQLLLAPQGYTLLAADSGEAALQVAASHDGPIDLLVSDVVMPGMNGPELARRLRESRPEIPVLFVSGYTENAIVHGGVLEPGLHFLGKPFTRRTLTVKVRAVLDGTDGQKSGDA